MKKFIILILAALAWGCLCGCADYLDAEYQASSPHIIKEELPLAETAPDAEVYIPSGNITSLDDAVIGLIRARAEYGVIRIANYNGDINADAEAVCLGAAYESAYGAYAVNYVSFAVNNYVPFSEVKVYFTYKEGIKDDKYISAVDSAEEARSRVEAAMHSFSGDLTFITTAEEIDTRFMLDCVAELYFDGCAQSPVMPHVTAASYPEVGETRIIELKLSYPYSTYRMATMRDRTQTMVTELVGRLEGLDEREAVTTLCTILSTECEYAGYGTDTDEYDRRTDKYTAYGALALGRASGEGYAMAVQMVCRELDIESMVVLGRHENVAHAWNIIRVDGEYYHFDASLLAQNGAQNTFMLNDERFAQSYFWDLDRYPACTVDRLAGTETTPAAKPQTPPAAENDPPEDAPVVLPEGSGEGDGGDGSGTDDDGTDADAPAVQSLDPPEEPTEEIDGNTEVMEENIPPTP